MVFGDRAVLVTCADRDERRATRARLVADLPRHSVREGVRALLVVAERPDPTLLDSVCACLSAARPHAQEEEARTVTIQVTYDGIDLDETAHALGLTAAELVHEHQAQAWVVDVMGFAPGFGYLLPFGDERADWSRLDRRASPRDRVPGGSVALAAGMSAVYPVSMPGGWHLIGRTPAAMFDANNPAAPSLLVPGAIVWFTETPA